jgi:hypothetical protein
MEQNMQQMSMQMNAEINTLKNKLAAAEQALAATPISTTLQRTHSVNNVMDERSVESTNSAAMISQQSYTAPEQAMTPMTVVNEDQIVERIFIRLNAYIMQINERFDMMFTQSTQVIKSIPFEIESRLAMLQSEQQREPHVSEHQTMNNENSTQASSHAQSTATQL